MVKSKHIEDLSQGYRWGWHAGATLVFRSTRVQRVFHSLRNNLFWFQDLWRFFARGPGGVSGCQRGERLSDLSLWTHDQQVSQRTLNGLLVCFCQSTHGFTDSLFIYFTESQRTWRLSPLHCSGCVLALFPTPTTTSHPETHTSVLWASRPWVRLCWAGSFTQQSGQQSVKDLKSLLKHPPRSCGVYFSAHKFTNTDTYSSLMSHEYPS